MWCVEMYFFDKQFFVVEINVEIIFVSFGWFVVIFIDMEDYIGEDIVVMGEVAVVK